MSTWVIATMGCAISFNFGTLLFFRMLVGVGEASFISLAAPFIGERHGGSATQCGIMMKGWLYATTAAERGMLTHSWSYMLFLYECRTQCIL